MDTNALSLNPGEQMQDDEALYLAQEYVDNEMVYSSYDHLQDSLAIGTPSYAPVPQIALECTHSDSSSYRNGTQLMRADDSNPLLLNTTGSWNGNSLDDYGGNITQQFTEHGFPHEQAVSDTNKLSFFAQALDLDPWNPSEAPEMIRGLNGPMMQSYPYNNAAGIGISQPDQSYTNSTHNLTSTMPSFTQATASTVSDNSRGWTTTTRSHISSQTNLTAPDAVHISARALRSVRQKIYHCTCTSKRCTKMFLRPHDWERHEESHWPQKHYLCLRCVEKPGRLDDSQCSYCKCTILEGWERHTLSCSDAQSDGKCFTREEHLRNHLRSGHRVSGSTSKTEAKRCFFRVESEWPRQCGFCNTIFTSWGQRAKHIRRHFRIDRCTIGMWREIPVLPLDDDDGLSFYQNNEDDSDDEVARREPRPSAASLDVWTSFTSSKQNNWQASEHGSYNSRGAVDHEKSHDEFLKLPFDMNQNYCIRPKHIPHPEEEVKRSLQKSASRVLLIRRSAQKSVQVLNDPLVKYRATSDLSREQGAW
ncbi:hypothetical protein ACMFMG_003569 [Clarireedia jacksonii]